MDPRQASYDNIRDLRTKDSEFPISLYGSEAPLNLLLKDYANDPEEHNLRRENHLSDTRLGIYRDWEKHQVPMQKGFTY